jgi:hypothetical protein
MLTLPGSVKIFLCLVPIDMRLSFDRLSALAREFHGEAPLSGHLYVFSGRRRDRCIGTTTAWSSGTSGWSGARFPFRRRRRLRVCRLRRVRWRCSWTG